MQEGYPFMKILIIHGQNHKGSTYHIAHQLAQKLPGDVDEIFLPRDFGFFCTGCTQCFMQSETHCPHYEALCPLTEKMDAADVLILESPVYVYHVTGSMKAFLDHFGYRWIIHRPSAAMFRKQAVVISTAAGAGIKSTNKDMTDSLFWWGVGRIYRFGLAVGAIRWSDVPEKKKQKIEKATSALAAKLIRRHGRVIPSLKTRAVFYCFSRLQRKPFNVPDGKYWKEMGWTQGKKPWEETIPTDR